MVKAPSNSKVLLLNFIINFCVIFIKVTYAYLKIRIVLKGRLRKSSVLLPPFPEGLLWLSPFLSIHVYITFSPVVTNLLNFLWTYEFILFFTYIPVHLSNAINIFSSAQIICYFFKKHSSGSCWAPWSLDRSLVVQIFESYNDVFCSLLSGVLVAPSCKIISKSLSCGTSCLK